MKIYLISVLTCVGILVRCSASDQFGEKKSSEQMEKSEQVNTLGKNKPEKQSDASNVEAATELAGVRRANARKNDAVDDGLDEAKSQSAESNHLPTSTQLSTLELFDKYLEKYGAKMKNNKGVTFEDLVKHLEKDELMLMTKAYEVLANGHDNLVKKLREHTLTTATTTTTPRSPVFQSRSLRYRPKYKKLSSKQPVGQDPTLFFINDGRIYSIKRHS